MIAEILSQKPFFSKKEAEIHGLSARMITYYLKRGIIERIARGIYRHKKSTFDGNLMWEELLVATKAIPNGVICLISALSYYDMTDQFMREIWIAIPNEQQVRAQKNMRIIRMRNMDIGVTEKEEGGIKFKIFDQERTIIDSFRLLDLEIAIKALKAYVGSSEKTNYKRLNEYARKLRFDITPYLQTLIT